MNRGSLSFFTLFALALWGALFFSGALPALALPVAALICLGAAVALAPLSAPRLKRAGLLLAFLGLGLLAGSLRLPESTRWHRYPPLLPGFTAYTAIAPERVGEFRGRLCADSTATPVAARGTGRFGSTQGRRGPARTLAGYAVRLEQVASADGQQRGSARGIVLLWVPDGPMLFQGQGLTVFSGLEPAREPGRYSYVSRAKPQELRAGGFQRRLDSRRAAVLAAVQERLRRLDPSVSAMLSALLLGRREELDGGVYGSFRSSGSLHLLALSGLHLGILYFFLFLLLRAVPDLRARRLAAGVLLVGYVLLVGRRPSLERALVMLLVAGAGYWLDREIEPLNLLGVAACLLLLLRPYYAFDLSFQLSFVSLAAIILLGPLLRRLWQPWLPAFLGWPLAISLSAQIGTAPLALYHFGALHPVGVLASVLLIPLVSLFLGAGLLYVGLSFLSAVPAGMLGRGLFVLYRAIILILDLFSRAPGLQITWRSAFWGFWGVLLIPHFAITRKRRVRPC
jgi:ComEC/Rec2-related protein